MSGKLTRRVSTVAIGLAVSGAAALAAVPAANAAVPSSGASTAAAAAQPSAPRCITDREDKGRVYTTVWVTNECSRYYRVKLIMARGADSRCFSLRPGQTRSHESRGASPYLDRIVLC